MKYNYLYRSQIRNQLKRKAYEDAGLQPPVTSPTKPSAKSVQGVAEQHGKKQKTSGKHTLLLDTGTVAGV